MDKSGVFDSETISLIGTGADDTLTFTSLTILTTPLYGTIDGGAGTDTLQLVPSRSVTDSYFDFSKLSKFEGIEIIRGSAEDDIVTLRADHLAGIATIDGGAAIDGNFLVIQGASIDLRGHTIQNFKSVRMVTNEAVLTVSDKTLALTITGTASQNDHLILEGGTFTDAERQLLHSHGIDKITDASGAVSIDAAPVISGLDADLIRISAGQTARLDVGADAAITNDDGAIKRLGVLVLDPQPMDRLEIDTTGRVQLSDGPVDGSRVSVGGIEIGQFWTRPSGAFEISFNAQATPALVNELVRSFTYVNTSTDAGYTGFREIRVTATDSGGRHSEAIVGVTIAAPGVTTLTPGVDNLIGTGANEEFIAGRSAVNDGDALDGGTGFDTLRFVSDTTGFSLVLIDLTKFSSLRGIEKLQGSNASEAFELGSGALAEISVLDGGGESSGPGNMLFLHGSSIDLRNKTISNFESISIEDDGASLTINDASLVNLIEGRGENVHVTFAGGTLSRFDREQLLFHGIETVTDASGTYTDDMPTTGSDLNPPPLPPTPNSIKGTATGDVLTGSNRDDIIRAFAGNDVVMAGDGNDVVFGDLGNDRVLGNNQNDKLYGGGGKDILQGGAGNDQLWGEADKDVLTGGAGQDIFVFNTKPGKTNMDKITDFSVKDDTIWLDNRYMKKLGKGSEAKPSKLNKKYFKVGDKAKDKDDYLVYDKKKGVLYYDDDGSGGHRAVEIATLKKGLKMTYQDFMVI